MTKARELADVIGTQDTTENVLQGRRNLIINGAMQVWQRNTSVTSDGYQSVDRFWVYSNDKTSGAITRSTDVPSTESFPYSLSLGMTSVAAFGTNIELPIQGKSVLKPNTDYTLSFWVKGANNGGTFNFLHRYRDAAMSGTNTVNLAGDATTVTVTTDWQKVVITFNSGTTTPNSTNNLIDLEFSGSGGLTGAKFTGFQYEVGSVATPFEHRSYGEELALCKRYYEIFGASEINWERFATGFVPVGGTGTASYMLQYEVQKRATPTCSVNNGNDFYVYTASSPDIPTSLGFSDVTFQSANINCNRANLTAGQGSMLLRNGSSSQARIYVDAEL